MLSRHGGAEGTPSFSYAQFLLASILRAYRSSRSVEDRGELQRGPRAGVRCLASLRLTPNKRPPKQGAFL